MQKTTKRLTGLVTALAFLAGVPVVAALAADYEVPPQLQISILLKVLVYDRSLAGRSRDGLLLSVVFDPHSEASRACKDGFVQAFKEAPRQLAGTTIVLSETPQENLEHDAEKGVDIIYLCNGTKTDKVIDLAKKKSLITFAPDELAVQQGVAIGLIPRDGKPKLLINVNGSIAGGMQLDPQILRLAELVRSDK